MSKDKLFEVMAALAHLHDVYFPKSGGREFTKMLDALDTLMNAYDEWLD